MDLLSEVIKNGHQLAKEYINPWHAEEFYVLHSSPILILLRPNKI